MVARRARAVTNRGSSPCSPPKRGLRVAPVPPKSADWTPPTRDRPDNGRSGRRNRRFDRTKEQPGSKHPGLAATITCHLQSATQWWVGLKKPRTQKFGYSRVRGITNAEEAYYAPHTELRIGSPCSA